MTACLSVIIPTYNGARFIAGTLHSILAQKPALTEIIIVDDASKDETCSIVHSIARNAEIPVKLISLEINSGSPSAPINVGIRHSTEDFIAVVDQDDRITENKFTREVGVLGRDVDLSVVCSCSADEKSAETRLQSRDVLAEITLCGVERDGYVELAGALFLELLLKHGCFPIGFPGFTFRRSAALSAGGVDERLRIADHDFLCKLATLGKVAFIPEIGYLRKFHDSNLSGDRLLVGRDFVEVIDRYIPLLEASARNRCRQLVVGSLTGIGYLLEDAGEYEQALRCIQIIGRTWGWDRKLAARFVKTYSNLLLRPLRAAVSTSS